MSPGNLLEVIPADLLDTLSLLRSKQWACPKYSDVIVLSEQTVEFDEKIFV